MKQENEELERNQKMTIPSVFMDLYNRNVPLSFPKVSMELLEKFQQTYPALFKLGDKWSVEKHRKRLMDWLATRRDA